MAFKKLEIIKPILEAIKQSGYEKPSPIQASAIPILLSGKDIMGSAQTGTGKTAAFAIPLLQNINQLNIRKGIKALILTPTRELAMQIKESLNTYGKFLSLKSVVIYGGVKQKSQVERLKKGCDILVATPGRLLDLMNQQIIKLNNVEYLVLDEADRMLDMGFIKDVKRIVNKIPNKRQTMLFSATLPKSILNLADSILTNPERVEITPVETTLDTIEQTVYYVEKNKKLSVLITLLKKESYKSILVFSRTKHGANKIVKRLIEKNISALPIHGNKSQSARTEALYLFKQNKVRVLVATDLAARGLDIDDLSLVINYDLPDVPETYIHRIGRTGRASKTGLAISFVSKEEEPLLQGIQKHIKMYIPVSEAYPYHSIFNTEQVIKPNYNKKTNSNKLNVNQYKKQIDGKSKKKQSTELTEKIKHSQPKKKTEPNLEKKRGWAKAKPKSKFYGSKDKNTSTKRKNYSTKKH